MQQLFSFINLFNSALHVSGDKFAHPQEHFFGCIYSFWYNAPTLLPTGATVEMELQENLCVQENQLRTHNTFTPILPTDI